MNNKSAKDKAFDRERAKYRHEITELNRQLDKCCGFLEEKEQTIVTLNSMIETMQEEIRLLAELLKLPEDDLALLLNKVKEDEKIKTCKEELLSLSSAMGHGCAGTLANYLLDTQWGE